MFFKKHSSILFAAASVFVVASIVFALPPAPESGDMPIAIEASGDESISMIEITPKVYIEIGLEYSENPDFSDFKRLPVVMRVPAEHDSGFIRTTIRTVKRASL